MMHPRWITRLVLLLVVSSLFAPVPAAAQGDPPIPPAIDPAPIAADYPRVDGSTSTLPLQRMVACVVLEVPCEWMTSLFGGREITPGLDFADSPQAAFIQDLWHSGTHGAYVSLIAGGMDVILVARAPSEDELIMAEAYQVVLDVQPVALDAFVFLLHVDNPVKSLSLDTIRAIYTGEITTWDKVPGFSSGAEPTPIQAFLRDRNSGSQELMDDLVMQGRPIIDAPDMMFETMMGPISAVGHTPAGIGYSVYFYAAVIQPSETIKLSGIEGVVPTVDTIADRSYPLTAEVYVVIREDMPPDSTARLLRDWLLTEAGQAAVALSGYVPVVVPDDPAE